MGRSSRSSPRTEAWNGRPRVPPRTPARPNPEAAAQRPPPRCVAARRPPPRCVAARRPPPRCVAARRPPPRCVAVQSPPTRVTWVHGGCMVTRRTAFLVLIGFGLLAAGVRADQGLLGFSDERARAQRALEQRFDCLLNADDLRAWMRPLSARPHHLGSPYGKENADLLASLFRSWGYDTRIEEFRVLFPTPKTRVLEMLEPTRFTASLAEPALKEDATSGQTSEQLPVYNAYSIDGDVTAPLVYVNYGGPRDYEELARHGVHAKGKTVIERYRRPC